MAWPKPDPNEPVTRKMLDEVVEAILAGTEGLFNNLRREMNSRFEKADRRFDKIEVELRHVKDQVSGLIADLSDTPSRREFEDLKSKVDRHHPAHDLSIRRFIFSPADKN